MSERDHDLRREELSAYLLGALDPGEAAELERHLAGCENCRAELAWLRPAAGVLPEAVERREPPPQLRARIMADVRAEAASPAPGHGARGWLDRLRGGPPGRASRPLRLAAGFAAVALIAAGVAAFAIRDAGGPAGETTTVVAGEGPGLTAEMVSEGDAGTLRLANVRRLGTGEGLQAWVRRGGQVEPAGGLFVPNRDGVAVAAIGDMRGVDAVMVTAEPRGGSEFPTSDPLISIPVPQ